VKTWLNSNLKSHKSQNLPKKNLREGFEMIWAKDISEALHILKHDKPANYDGLFIQQRDSMLLESAKAILF